MPKGQTGTLRLITCELAYCGTRRADTEAHRKPAMKMAFPDLTTAGDLGGANSRGPPRKDPRENTHR